MLIKFDSAIRVAGFAELDYSCDLAQFDFLKAHNLYNQSALSDIKLSLKDGTKVNGHKFLLTARSKGC